MKMMMFQLVSVAALLVSPAVSNTVHNPHGNLRGEAIIELVEDYNKTLYQQIFVEDLTHLVVSGCEDKFFCKAHDILHEHEKFGKNDTEEQKIVRKLDSFTKGMNANCTELIEGLTPTGDKTPIPNLLENIVTCIKKRNFSGN